MKERSTKRRAAWAFALMLAALVIAPPSESVARGGASTFSPLFIQMEHLSVPVFGRDRIKGQVYVGITIALDNLEQRPAVVRRLPRLKDAYFRYLYREASLGRFDSGMLDQDEIKRIFQKTADRIVGVSGIEVLINKAQFFKYPSNLRRRPRRTQATGGGSVRATR